MELVDGRHIAREKEKELKKSFSSFKEDNIIPRLEALSFGDNRATQSFLSIKKRVAERIGVTLVVHELPSGTVERVAREVLSALIESKPDGIVVQLPLPKHINKDELLNMIPLSLDVDCISPRSLELFSRGENLYDSPVAGAVDEVLARHRVSLEGKRVAVVGYGDLVGKPVSYFLKNRGTDSVLFDSDSNLFDLREFDIVISGVGKPGLIKREHLRNGVVLIDAGTSEAKGKLSGDIDLNAREIASLVTPVPGGVGPITVIKLFENLLLSLKNKKHA
ncbi:MAG: bifunctional 5,10-methylenetetrahydrofolate dehydrogenase/5,10-methenyltetrahydrofolate cyclohydrolase [Candidatus Paceibacterota bacterium]